MMKMKKAMGLAALLMGASILVGCSPPAEETKAPQAGTGGTAPAGGGTAPGNNATKAIVAKPQ